MSATLKLIGKGGTAKVKDFCHCCDCTSNKISHINPSKCEFCTDFIEQRPVSCDNWKCYHRQIITIKYKDEIKQQYDHLMNDLTTSLEEIDKHNEMKMIYHDQTEKLETHSPLILNQPLQLKQLNFKTCQRRKVFSVTLILWRNQGMSFALN